MAERAHKSFKLPESREHYPPDRKYRTSHIKVEVDVDFERRGIAGACTLEIEPVSGGLEKAEFDAVGLVVKGARVDGVPAGFDYDGSTLAVDLPPGGTRRSIRVEYSATPTDGLFFTGPDREHPEKEVQAWTHCEAEASRNWYPCHDHPADKSSSELHVTVPAEFRVISNGRLLSVEKNGGKATYRWREEIPHSTYLTSFVAGKFGELAQEANGVPLRYNFPESKRGDVLRYFGETPKMLEVFERLTGVKYPYLKYDQTTVEDFVAGGEENLNATTLAMSYYPDEASEEDFSTSYALPLQRPVDLVSHELAHQWFGDYVTCSDWAHAWLNEGFASYFQELYLENTRGVDEMIWHLDSRNEDYFDEDEKEYRRPIVERGYVWPDDLFDSHLYPKGASMLHELRFVVGDEAFFRGISHYLKRFALSAADTDDFRKAMEDASGVQLQEFFEQSFHRAGHPEFEVEYAWDEERKTATLRVMQVQKEVEGAPIFKLPCEVVFYLGKERRSYRALLDAPQQSLVYSLPSKPTVVEFDPRRWLLKEVKFEKPLGLLLNQLGGSQDAWSRAEAAKALGKMKAEGAVEGLSREAAKEQYWYVRACAYGALGEIGTEGALKAILATGIPRDRRARRGLAAALGRFKGEEAREVLVGMLEGDESPFVRCEAALGLAKSWPEGALPHLKAGMKVHTVNETLAEACLAAMGRLKDDEVMSIVRESLAYGKPGRVRVGALKAIKERGRILDEEVPLLREMMVHDKEFRVRMQIVQFVIRSLKDRRFLDALRGMASSDPHLGIRRKALEVCYELEAAGEPSEELAKLRGEVEELKRRSGRPPGSAP